MLRKVWLACGWLGIAGVFFLSLTPMPPQPFTFNFADKLEHGLAYALLALWFCQIYAGKARLRLLLLLVAMGVLIEYLQRMTGYRYFEYADMLANATGVMFGWGLAQTRLGRVLTMLEIILKTAVDRSIEAARK
ncbi:MAG: VanZ family protein [Sideroxydans sp.]|nr:VanZ family protein [Sideroxydans sp.]